MPGIIAAFFALIGIGAGSALLGPPLAWSGVDPTSRNRYGKPAPVEYLAWSAQTAVTLARERRDGPTCEVTFFALTTGRGGVRLKVDGQEQPIDRSWTIVKVVKPNERAKVDFEFIDPVTRESVMKSREVCCADPRRPGFCVWVDG